MKARTSYMARACGEVVADDDPLLDFAPAPHTHPRANSITAERQRAFVAQLLATGMVKDAAVHIGASTEALYALRHKPGAEGFAAAWDEAVERAILQVEHAAMQRAIHGVERPIVSGGKLLGWYPVHNEALVMFLLRQRRPDKYGAELALRLKPGDKLYEQIKREVIDAERNDPAYSVEALDKFLQGMVQRRKANTALLEEFEAEDRRERGEDDGED